VDDLLIAAKQVEKINEIKKKILEEFEMVDFGEAQTILGIDILRDWNRKTLVLHQSAYVDHLLQKFRQKRTRCAPSPINRDERPVSKSDCPTFASAIAQMKAVPYREAIGSLMHIMVCTRPDIACAVGILSRFLQNPGPRHWAAAMRVIKYLHKTRFVGLCYRQILLRE
jgi:ATP-binding cassette subfamily B (MDR/TAP) protein 1